MKISIPLAQESAGFDLSTVGQLAYALGRMTGGMIVDKELDLGNCDITFMVIQSIMLDAGDKRSIHGISPGATSGTFVVLSDGSVELFTMRTDGANLEAESHVATTEEIHDCEAYLTASSMMSMLATADLDAHGWLDGDEYYCRTAVDAGAALQGKCEGTAFTVVKKSGSVSSGYVSKISGAKNGMTIEEAAKLVVTTVMSSKEVEEEYGKYSSIVGEGDESFTNMLFNQPIGQA